MSSFDQFIRSIQADGNDGKAFEVFAKWMRDKQGVDPELVVREGEPMAEIMAQIEEDTDIGVLVLGASSEKRGPGPLIAELSRNFGSLPIPGTIVPGDLSKGEAGQALPIQQV